MDTKELWRASGQPRSLFDARSEAQAICGVMWALPRFRGRPATA